MGCSLGCLLRQVVFPLTGQHAAGLPVPQRVHTPLPGAPVFALYSLAQGSWRCAEARPPHFPHGRSLTAGRKKLMLLLFTDYILNSVEFQGQKRRTALHLSIHLSEMTNCHLREQKWYFHNMPGNISQIQTTPVKNVNGEVKNKSSVKMYFRRTVHDTKRPSVRTRK